MDGKAGGHQKVGAWKMKKKAKVKHLQEVTETEESESNDEDDDRKLPVFTIKSPGLGEISVPVKMQGKEISMELDTGSSCRHYL